MAKKFQRLADNPNLGRMQNDFILNLCSLPYKDLKIFYFSDETAVEIYRVLHGARNIEDLFEDYFEGLKP